MTPTTSARADGPLSFAQQRRWFLARFDPDHTPHQGAWFFDLRGSLDTTRFITALRALIERHGGIL